MSDLTTERVRAVYVEDGTRLTYGERGAEFDIWLEDIRAAAWSQGRRESTDLVSDATGFRVVARNADNPYKHEIIGRPLVPKRIQMSRQRPWRAENPDAIKVDRTTRWGNPYKVSETVTPEQAIAAFRFGIRAGYDYIPSEGEISVELRGHDLACWCPLDQPCHADVLLEIANKH